MREGEENYLKYLKGGWNRTKGRGNKDFKKGAQAGLKGGWAGNPLRTMQMLLDKSVHARQTWIVASRKRIFLPDLVLF